MSLQVWLPLNKDTKNYGHSNKSISGGSYISSETKLGGGSYAGSININYGLGKSSRNMSTCFWFKLKNTSDNGSILTVAFTGNTRWYFNIDQQAAPGKFYGAYGSTGYNTTFSRDTNWHHLVMCADNLGNMRFYIDGELDGMIDARPEFNLEGNFAVSSLAYYNDIRIYDHCLSEKEIKELSKGLIVNFPLNDLLIEPTLNRIITTKYLSPASTSIGWDLTLHANAIYVANSAWSAGWNAGVPSPSIGYHAMWKMIDGIPTMEFNDLNSQYGLAHRWLGIATSSIKGNFILEAGKKYTISFDAKSTNSLHVNGGLYYNNGSGTNFHDGSFYVYNVGKNWKRYSRTLTTAYDITASISNISLYIYGFNNSREGTTWVRNVQIEYGDHATAYNNGILLREGNPIIYDITGNQNNGVLVGSATVLDNDNRYTKSTHLTTEGIRQPVSTYNYIKAPVSLITPKEITVSYWYKRTSAYLVGSFFCTTSVAPGGENEFSDYSATAMSTTDNYMYFRVSGTTYKISNSKYYTTDGVWHHYVYTFNGSLFKIYVDSQLKDTADASGNLVSFKLIILNYNCAGAVRRSETCDYSDFRMYATCLNLADINELYSLKLS